MLNKKKLGKIVIVGSGASGVHFALSLLRKGHQVKMLDVGHPPSNISNPEGSFNDLKSNLNDPIEYFLGKDFQAVIFPDSKAEYYGFPPNKDYVFNGIPYNQVRTIGFSPLMSFAEGGLAEVWTGGCYPFTDDDLTEFPFTYKDIEPYYEEVSNRIGITGVNDDLVKFFPYHKKLMNPIELDEHSQYLLKSYEKKRRFLNENLGFFLGRSRTSILSQDKEDRKKCNYNGRCLWGCPTKAFYTPSITLRECMSYSNFDYVRDEYVSYFKFNSGNKITSVVTFSIKNNNVYEYKADRLILAAGTLSSSKIFLSSIFRDSGTEIKLKGLMDNRQIMSPFINMKMIGKKYNPKSYQYHQLAIGLKSENGQGDVHALITTLKTALYHPIIQRIPCDIKTSIFLFRNLHSALGVININFSDRRRVSNYLTLQTTSRAAQPQMVIYYAPEEDERDRIKITLKKLNKALRKLQCIMPTGMFHVRPMGASVHYAGTIPMANKNTQYTTSKFCESHDFKNLYFADGTTFPFLPAKNLTFTLMANAVRIAENVF